MSTKSLPDPSCFEALRIRGHEFVWGTRTFVMGIINLTPDSFSGDGLGGDPHAAVAVARRMEAEGADILDLGAESSRPGAVELPPELELDLLLPSLLAVREATDLALSVDTCHPSVAEAALTAGADMINDIHGLRRDPEMARIVAKHGAAVVAMHNQRGHVSSGVVASVRRGFEATITIAATASIAPGRLVLDPGFGFGWAPEQNLEMVRRLRELRVGRHPLLLGPSRKSTIGYVLGTPVDERVEGTGALVALAVANGADIVRVHDVREIRRVALVADAVVRDNWRYHPEAT